MQLKTLEGERKHNLEFCRRLQDPEDFHCRFAEDFATLEDELQKYAALHPYFESADRMLALRDLEDLIVLDGNMPQFPKAADKLRAFIDRYIKQGEQLKSARAKLEEIKAFGEWDWHAAKAAQWLNMNPEATDAAIE